MSLAPHVLRSIENLLDVEDVNVVKILGQGTFGMAVLIDAPALIKPLVVKLFQSEDGFYTCFREYVLQDNFAVLGLAPYVVGVALNVVTNKTSSAFIIMEQVDGTLYELIQSPLSYSVLVNIAKELIMMVDTACSHSLTHADLHLHNIGYKHANNYLQFLFLDFGLTVSKCTNVLVDLLALITMTFTSDIVKTAAMEAALVLRQEFIKEFKKRAAPMRWPQEDDKYGWDTVHIDTRNAYGVKGLKMPD